MAVSSVARRYADAPKEASYGVIEFWLAIHARARASKASACQWDQCTVPTPSESGRDGSNAMGSG